MQRTWQRRPHIVVGLTRVVAIEMPKKSPPERPDTTHAGLAECIGKKKAAKLIKEEQHIYNTAMLGLIYHFFNVVHLLQTIE